MKKLLFLLALIISVASQAQTIQYLGTTNTQIYVRGQMRIDTVVYLPLRDTTFTPSQIGALIVKGSQPYLWNGVKWISVAMGPPVYGQFIGTLSNQTDLQNALNAKQDVVTAGYGIKKTGVSIAYDSAAVRKVDTLYALNDSTILYTLNGVSHTALLRGTPQGGIFSLVLNTSGTPYINPVTFSNTAGAWSGSLVLSSQNANTVWSGPSIGSPAQPTFRALTTADLPTGIPNANLANATITYATSTAGSDIGISPSTVALGGTVTVAVPSAGPSSRGALTSGDWTSFNNKPISVNGQTGVVITLNADSITKLPVDTSNNRDNYLLTFDSINHKYKLTAGASAGVTSVALTAPAILNVAGSPITTSGTLALTLANQTQNKVFASPDGSTGTPTFRAVVNADLPTSGVSPGTYNSVTLNAQGIATAASNVGTGITSLNGLTGGTQTFSTGTAGSDFNISSASTTHTFNLPTGDATHRGAISTTDWSTFNSKLTSTLASANIFVGNGSNVATAVSPSGDWTMTNAGVSTIQPNAVSYAKIQAAAGQGLMGATGAGNFGLVTLGSGLSMTGSVLNTSTLYVFNVKDYGALGDGVTNDITAINNCFAAAMAYPFQATIIFPAGIYLINGAITSITRSVLIQGINATIKSSVSTSYNIINVTSDSVRLYGLKILGNTQGQVGININGYKYFDLQDCELTSLSRGIRFANTAVAFNAGNINLCNFYSNLIGLFSDSSGEYVTASNCLLKGNTVAIQDDGGNNIYANTNVNSNTTAFKFTGGANNSHGIIIGCNANHNSASFDVTGANLGETVVGGHFYEGTMSFTNSTNWRFTSGCILSPSSLTINNCANMDFSQANIFSTYGTTRNFSGNINRPFFNSNFGDVASSITTPNGSVIPLVDSVGGILYRNPQTSDTIDLGVARWLYKSLSADDTIKKIIHPTAGRIYRLEVISNGHNFVMLDNTKVAGTFNPSAALNIYSIECIDDGADPRFLVSVSQPGLLVSRPTNGVGWSRITGAGTTSINNLTKTGPDGTAFTVWAYPDKVLSGGDGYYVAQAAASNANIIWGLSTTAVQNSYNSINYAIYFFSTSGAANNVNVVESGTIISTGLGGTSWSTNDSFRVKVTGTTVTYEKFASGSWSVFFTSTHAVPSYPLIPQVAIRAVTTFTNPRIYGAQVTNNLQAYFAVGYADNLNATQASTGLVRIAALDSLSKDAKGMQISSVSIVPQTADASFPGLVSTGTQTFAGAKTFNGSITSNSLGVFNHYIAGAVAPSTAADVGAGTGPTISITGTDQDGVLTVLTGTLPSAGTIVTATYTTAFATNSFPTLTPANTATSALSGVTAVFTTGTTTTFFISSGATPLTAATTYKWYYHVGGN